MHGHIQIVGIVDGPSWYHTQGMRLFGLPELEIVGVPRYLYLAVGSLLNEIADYMINKDGVVSAGQTMQVGPSPPCMFIESPGREEIDSAWYDGKEVLRIVDFEGNVGCAACPGDEHMH